MLCLVSIRALNLEAGDKTYAENGKRCKLNALKISCNNSLECDSLKWEKPVGMECDAVLGSDFIADRSK